MYTPEFTEKFFVLRSHGLYRKAACLFLPSTTSHSKKLLVFFKGQCLLCHKSYEACACVLWPIHHAVWVDLCLSPCIVRTLKKYRPQSKQLCNRRLCALHCKTPTWSVYREENLCVLHYWRCAGKHQWGISQHCASSTMGHILCLNQDWYVGMALTL